LISSWSFFLMCSGMLATIIDQSSVVRLESSGFRLQAPGVSHHAAGYQP
jgi:hypothetical protein